MLGFIKDLAYWFTKGHSYKKWVKCPVCGHWTLNDYWICPHCKWEMDPGLENPKLWSAEIPNLYQLYIEVEDEKDINSDWENTGNTHKGSKKWIDGTPVYDKGDLDYDLADAEQLYRGTVTFKE